MARREEAVHSLTTGQLLEISGGGSGRRSILIQNQGVGSVRIGSADVDDGVGFLLTGNLTPPAAYSDPVSSEAYYVYAIGNTTLYVVEYF
jgi:hypothetical protein